MTGSHFAFKKSDAWRDKIAELPKMSHFSGSAVRLIFENLRSVAP